MRFLIDAQLPPALAQQLAARGHQAEHVSRVGLRGASDDAIWQYAARAGAILLTKDEDFVALAEKESSGPQVVWVRLGNVTNDALWRAVGPMLDEIVRALNDGERIVEVI